MGRKVKQRTRLAERTFSVGGFDFATPAAPWCDCSPMEGGFTKRDDGCWVRPCCMRRTKEAYDKHGDQPVPPIVPSREQAGATA